MKKNIYFIILSLMTVGILTGCEDFLNKNPRDKVSDAIFWQTQEDAEKALVACYNTMYDNPLLNHTHSEWDGYSDNCYNNGGPCTFYVTGILTPQAGGYINTMYYGSYKAIARYNDFIVHVEKMALPEETKNSMLGQVKFFRALYYFNMTQIFGEVPVITEPYEIGDELKMKSPQSEIYDLIHQDLDFSIAHLKDVKYDGHVGLGAAKLLKVRVLMAQRKWAEAAKVAKSIMTGTFSLCDNYQAMFEEEGQTDNPEIMLSTRYAFPLRTHNNPTRYGAAWVRICPFEDLVQEYECTDGKSIEESPLYDSKKPYENRDPRLAYSIVCPGSEWRCMGDDYLIYDPFNDERMAAKNVTNYLMRKGFEWKRTIPTDPNAGASSADAIVMRYAEVLLNFAESENEANGPTSDVYAAINEVRARKGVDMPALPAGLSKDQMRERIRHERRVELAFENGLRFFDLKRWGIEEETLNGFDTKYNNQKMIFKPHFTLWPIPQKEIDYYKAHDAEYVQNKGY